MCSLPHYLSLRTAQNIKYHIQRGTGAIGKPPKKSLPVYDAAPRSMLVGMMILPTKKNVQFPAHSFASLEYLVHKGLVVEVVDADSVSHLIDRFV